MRATLALLLLLATAACANPVAPSEYTCKTKPRAYVSPAGVVAWEVDTYTQAMPCPATPID